MEIRDIQAFSNNKLGNKRNRQKIKASKQLNKSKNIKVLLHAILKFDPERICL